MAISLKIDIRIFYHVSIIVYIATIVSLFIVREHVIDIYKLGNPLGCHLLVLTSALHCGLCVELISTLLSSN